ncbi:integrase [Bradyrhizobium sp. GM5.1]
MSPHGSKSRARTLTDHELKLIWQACEQRGFSGDLNTTALERLGGPALPASYCNIVQLLILTGQRKNEVASLQTSWIKSSGLSSSSSPSSDGSTSSTPSTTLSFSPSDLWTITLPASVTKNGREHTFPLGVFSAALLTKVGSTQTRVSGYIFSARTGSSKNSTFSGWSKAKVALDRACGVKAWTLHDIRRTYRTIHGRIGTPPHIAERLVNHVSSRTEVDRIYDRHTYLDEMRRAVDSYEQYLLHHVIA